MCNDYIPSEVKELMLRLNECIFQSYSDVDEAIMTLEETASRYDYISIADVYDAYTMSIPFTYQNAAEEWGWDEKTIKELRPMLTSYWKYTIKFPTPKNLVKNDSDAIPFTGGYVWSNPYEITRYEYKLSCTDGHKCEMEILCKDNNALSDLRNFIKSLHCDDLMQVTINMDPNSRARINIETRHQPLAASIKKFVDGVNRQLQTKPSNMPVFQYGHDVIPLGKIGEVKINPQGIEFTCNIGRGNGKTMTSKDFINSLYGTYPKKDVEITKEMKDMTVVAFELMPKKIIFSGPKCIVLWVDGTKTIVSCSENDQWDEYAAYCAALAKKLYGTTSAVHRMVDKKSNAKEYRKALADDWRKALIEAMKPYIKEDNDEHSEH